MTYLFSYSRNSKLNNPRRIFSYFHFSKSYGFLCQITFLLDFSSENYKIQFFATIFVATQVHKTLIETSKKMYELF